jgi:glucose 1-dehydrogenase
MSSLLDRQRALVTGASSDIGAAIARQVAGAGATVVVNYVSGGDNAHHVVAGIERAGGEALAIHADVSDQAQVQAMFSEAIEALGSIDILVNNAGIQKDSAFLDMSLEDWDRVIAVNLTGYFLCAREAAREFMRHGVIPERSIAAGKIICISSVHETIPWAGRANYAVSKAGIAMLMKTMAQGLAPHRIWVNAIAPGAIKTDINREAWKTQHAEAGLLRLIPYGRIGEVGDVARIAVWLASDEADYINGTTLYVDGGMALYPAFREGG